MEHSSEAERERFRTQIRQEIKELFGITDTRGLDVLATLGHTAHLAEQLQCQASDDCDLSGPRWRLMMRLFASERMGHAGGVTPTVLSRSQRVSKNTISALLRGLEEQGLIQRATDPNDLRAFHIQLTDAGREHIHKTAPERIKIMNELLSDLQPEEISQLGLLLNKLHDSLLRRLHQQKSLPDLPGAGRGSQS